MTQGVHDATSAADMDAFVGEEQQEPALRRMGRWLVTDRWGKLLVTVVNVTLFGVLWQTITVVADLPTIFLPSLTGIWGELQVLLDEGLYWSTVGSSVTYYVWTMVLSVAIAVPLGLLIGAIPTLDRTLGPYVWAAFMTPRIVFIPMILLWLGINEWGKLGILLTSTVPPIAVVVLDGAKTVDASLVKVGKAFGASRVQTLRKIVAPATIPFLGTAMRLGFARGLVGLFAAELFTASEGLGFVMYEASRQFNTERVFVMLLTFLVLALSTVSATSSLEKRLSRWRADGASL